MRERIRFTVRKSAPGGTGNEGRIPDAKKKENLEATTD
jgi:hypothetical protein